MGEGDARVGQRRCGRARADCPLPPCCGRSPADQCAPRLSLRPGAVLTASSVAEASRSPTGPPPSSSAQPAASTTPPSHRASSAAAVGGAASVEGSRRRSLGCGVAGSSPISAKTLAVSCCTSSASPRGSTPMRIEYLFAR